MFHKLRACIFFVGLCLPSIVSAQLAAGYPLGPDTTSSAKWAKKVCDVTKYGAVADGKTDLGPPLLAAFNACKSGGVGKFLCLDT
jgi:rhamnogalacturonan hydrolase